ncbi:twitching motility protein PilT [Granulicatella balaenopterae]|uniref:Twitching motility protein PilT n=1 Tax=Granulicatella balaenopterae TaxID=137733 RepID=A0A1H9KQM9_9LACT|nr:PilT/PilU family type 4a pilus ATPase [Granulicatella balaenopterae]SER01388.1 twitching motility protein PilT [Granulicatella balaenopterae]
MNRIEQLVEKAANLGASDIHIVKGLPVKCRLHGRLVDLDEKILTDEDCEQMAQALAGVKYQQMREIGEVDLGATLANERLRINIFRQQGSVSMALRILSSTIPELERLGLPPVVKDFTKWQKGIVLVTGETGSGKSTTLAALLNEINHKRQDHIITLEDPIEYIYTPDQCVINQRAIGEDTASYQDGLRAILREDPDIILIGEMRDLDTIETALTAAETGHLVFATLHTNSASDTIDRIVGVFPENRQQQIRMQLSMTLKAVLSQQLLPNKYENGRVLAYETMILTPAIKNLIREGKTPQIKSSILSSGDIGSITMDNCLAELVRANKIKSETAFANAQDVDFLAQRLGTRPPGISTWK